jgi:hypothetical protein
MLDDPELLGGVTRNIMIELRDNPQYTKHLADDDIQTMIRAMRASMGLARIKKESKKSGASRKSSKNIDEDMLSVLDGIDLGDLG